MTPSNCIKCNSNICSLTPSYDENKHFILCPKCKPNCKLYSKTFCLKNLLLPKDDLTNLKYLYAPKSQKYYLDESIEKIIKLKYDILNKQKERAHARRQARHAAQATRKEKLLQTLADNKLEYKKYGDSASYVKYGTPSLETVITNEKKHQIELLRRKKLIFKELSKYNIPYDETICYDFINGLADKSLHETIHDAQIEHFFTTYTDYLTLLKTHPPETAKDLALTNYLKKTDESHIHEIANKLIDQALRINVE